MTAIAESMLPLMRAYADGEPFAAWLNFSADCDDNGPVTRLAFGERHIGNVMIRALHGGAIAAFLEYTASAALYAHFNGERAISTINSDIDYLTSARAEDMRARARFIRIGRRLAFVEAMGWQRDEAAPVAIARLRLRIGDQK